MVSTRRHRLTSIDLFSGCGGTSCGLKAAGFDVLSAVEIDVKAQQTFELNHPEVRLYRQDIRSLDPASVMADLGLKRGELDLLAGCPPCQGFSRLGTRNKGSQASDARNDLIFDFLRFASVMLPKTIMLENVPGLAVDSRFAAMREKLLALGYDISSGVLDAADYQVPQRRRRLIVLASRVHSPEIAPPSKERMTVRQAFVGLESPSRAKDPIHAMKENRSRAVREIIAMIPKDGGSRSDLAEHFQLPCHRRRSGFFDVYGRMAWDSVAPTITSGCHNPSKGRFLHPSRNRAITLREAALLQGFPRNYRFLPAHGKESIALMIGNALPPPFIEAHASALRSGIL